MARPKPVPIVVTRVTEVNPRTIRVAFNGYPFSVKPMPAAYFELYFQSPTEWPLQPGGHRPPKRTFTPFRIDVGAGSCEVDFVLHGHGTATDWVSHAEIGTVLLAGPIKGGYSIPESDHLVLVGDTTAIPAIETILERVEDRRVTGIVEGVDSDDERSIGSRPTFDPIWVHRGHDPDMAGQLTASLIDTIEVPRHAAWWIAGERDSIRTMRDIVVERFDTPRANISLNAHWRLRPIDPRTKHGGD